MELGCDKVRSWSWNLAIAKLLRVALSNFNHFFPEGSVKTPLFFPPLPPASERCINPPSQLLSLVEDVDEVFDPPYEEPNVADTDIGHQIVPSAMDEESFNLLMISLRREILYVDVKIKSFGEDDVCLALKDEVSARLEKIDNANELCQGKIHEAILSLDELILSDKEKISILSRLADELNVKVRINSRQVKLKLSELIADKPSEKVSFDPQNEKEKRESVARYRKIKVKLNNHSSNCMLLRQKVDAHKDVELMSEHEIRVALLEWKDEWKNELENLKLK